MLPPHLPIPCHELDASPGLLHLLYFLLHCLSPRDLGAAPQLSQLDWLISSGVFSGYCPLTCLVFFRSPLIIVHLVFPLFCLFLIDSKRNNVFHFYAASFLKDWSVNLYFRMAWGFTSILIVIMSWMLTVLKRRIRWELTWYSIEKHLPSSPTSVSTWSVMLYGLHAIPICEFTTNRFKCMDWGMLGQGGRLNWWCERMIKFALLTFV